MNLNYIQSISAILYNLKVSSLFMTLSRHEVLRVVGLGALHFLVNVTGSAIHVVRYLMKAGYTKYVSAPPYQETK